MWEDLIAVEKWKFGCNFIKAESSLHSDKMGGWVDGHSHWEYENHALSLSKISKNWVQETEFGCVWPTIRTSSDTKAKYRLAIFFPTNIYAAFKININSHSSSWILS